MSGLQPGNLIVVAARPGIGKCSFAMNIARNIAVGGRAASPIFSLEMSRWEIGMRLLCGEARVPWDRIRNKRVGPDDWRRIVQAAEALHDAPLSHRGLGQREHRRHPREGPSHAQRAAGLALIIVDYLQLMATPAWAAPPRHPPAGDRRDQPVA